jgi:hypothetical protein
MASLQQRYLALTCDLFGQSAGQRVWQVHCRDVCDEQCKCSCFHAAQALGIDAYILLWLRYSAFLVLYPVGVGSELTMAALALSQVAVYDQWPMCASDVQRVQYDDAAYCSSSLRLLMVPAADQAAEATDLGASQCIEPVVRLLHSLHCSDAGVLARCTLLRGSLYGWFTRAWCLINLL